MTGKIIKAIKSPTKKIQLTHVKSDTSIREGSQTFKALQLIDLKQFNIKPSIQNFGKIKNDIFGNSMKENKSKGGFYRNMVNQDRGGENYLATALVGDNEIFRNLN